MSIPFINAILRYLQGDGVVLLPEMELTLFGLAILILGSSVEESAEENWFWRMLFKDFYAKAALVGTVFSAVTLWKLRATVAERGEFGGFHDSVVVDPFFLFFATLFLAATALVILLSVKYLEIEKEQEGEYYALLLFACVGMMFMASGVSLLYGLTGATNIQNIHAAFDPGSGLARVVKFSHQAGPMGEQARQILAERYPAALHLDPSLLYQMPIFLVAAFVLVAVGLFFKIAAVPFHQWAPDVYEGAPTPVTAYVSVASKTASFALLLRLFTSVFAPSHETWIYLIAGVAVASLTWGNLAALTQTNVKRLLAYSSISHVGYILLGLVAWNKTAFTGIAYYLLSYVFMTAGAFAVIIVLRQKGLIGEELDDLNGLYQRSPAAAVLLLIFMLSLAGIPPTAGFMGKYFIFLSLIETHHPVLAVFAVLYIVPALYYYFRIVVHAWLQQPGEAPRAVMTSAQAVALGVAVFVTLAAGLYPEPFTRLAQYAFGQ